MGVSAPAPSVGHPGATNTKDNGGLQIIQLQKNPQKPLQKRESKCPKPKGKSKKKSKLLFAGIIACIAAIVILILTLLAMYFKPFGLFAEEFTVDPPSSTQAQKAFETTKLPEPELGAYKYIDSSDLEQTYLGEYKVGEVEYSGSGDAREAKCEVSALAVYENSSVEVEQHLFLGMTYNKASEAWENGTIRNGNLEVTAVGAPDVEAIVESFPNILKSYDPQLAAMYLNAEIVEESSLNNEGGTMVFTLTKTNEDASTISCTANADVSWSTNSGWNVKITSVSGDLGDQGAEGENPDAANQQPPANEGQPQGGNNNNGGSSGSSGGSGSSGSNRPSQETQTTIITTRPEGGETYMQLVCYSGDLVEVPGTVQFDSSGRILLKTDAQIHVVFNGATYNTDYFEIIGSGNWTNGKHVVVIGSISATGSLSQAPLVINTYY